jgi:diacylglycerol kinase (ATP)
MAPFALKLSSFSAYEQWEVRSEKPTVVAAFANTPHYGGGMKIAPRAQIDDGKLDVCLLTDIDKFKLFCLFPTVYFGRHLSVPQVKYFQASSLRVETGLPMDTYADGEYVCRTPVEIGVRPKALQVIV